MSVSIGELLVGDHPQSWVDAGFSLDRTDACRIGSVAVRLVGTQGGRGIRSWSLRDLAGDVSSIDGLPTVQCDEAEVTDPGVLASHRNGATSIDHMVVISSVGLRTAEAVTATTGHEVRRIREVATGEPRRLQWFFRFGEVILELVGPERQDGPRESAAFYGLALNVSDIDALPGLYGAGLGRVKDAVQPGRRIASLRHEDFDISVPIAFMTPRDDRR